MHAIRNGERYWLNSVEEEELTNNNAGFRQQSLQMQYFFGYFRLPEKGETGQLYTAIQVLDIISARSGRTFSNTSSIAFGRTLNASGIPKTHTFQGNFYELIQI